MRHLAVCRETFVGMDPPPARLLGFRKHGGKWELSPSYLGEVIPDAEGRPYGVAGPPPDDETVKYIQEIGGYSPFTPWK